VRLIFCFASVGGGFHRFARRLSSGLPCQIFNLLRVYSGRCFFSSSLGVLCSSSGVVDLCFGIWILGVPKFALLRLTTDSVLLISVFRSILLVL
jgi:hypothetical protein